MATAMQDSDSLGLQTKCLRPLFSQRNLENWATAYRSPLIPFPPSGHLLIPRRQTPGPRRRAGRRPRILAIMRSSDSEGWLAMVRLWPW